MNRAGGQGFRRMAQNGSPAARTFFLSVRVLSRFTGGSFWKGWPSCMMRGNWHFFRRSRWTSSKTKPSPTIFPRTPCAKSTGFVYAKEKPFARNPKAVFGLFWVAVYTHRWQLSNSRTDSVSMSTSVSPSASKGNYGPMAQAATPTIEPWATNEFTAGFLDPRSCPEGQQPHFSVHYGAFFGKTATVRSISRRSRNTCWEAKTPEPGKTTQ